MFSWCFHALFQLIFNFLSTAAGETIAIAEEMAAHDSLQRIMGVAESRRPLKFQSKADEMNIEYDKENVRIEDLYRQQKAAVTSKWISESNVDILLKMCWKVWFYNCL